MDIRIREYTEADAEEAVRIWNHIVEEGAAFPPAGASYGRDREPFFFRAVIYRDCI